MKFTHQHHFDASVDDVVAMLANEEFVRERARASGSDNVDAIVDGAANEEFTVSIRRTIPARTIPAEFRSFVGTSLDVKYTEVWEPPGKAERVGTFAVEIAGAPGHVAGALELKDVDGGADFFAAGEVTAPMPLVRAMIEKTIAGAVTAALDAELAAGDDWLARH